MIFLLIRIYFLAKQVILLSDKSVRIFALKTQSATLICFASLKTRLFQSWLLLRFLFLKENEIGFLFKKQKYKRRLIYFKKRCDDFRRISSFYPTVSTLIRFVLPETPFVMPPVTIILSPDSSPNVAIALFFAA